MTDIKHLPDLNVFELLRREIERRVREKITQDVTEKVMKEFEQIITLQLDSLVEQITIDKISTVLEAKGFQEELRVFVQMSNKNQ